MINLKQAFLSLVRINRNPDFLTRTDPATGTVTYEEWCKNDKLHRVDGPAYIVRNAATGNVTYEAWRKDGKRDRADGPALIERDAVTAKVTHAEWWKGGKLFEPSAQVRAAWLKKDEQENAARLAASSAPVPPSPM